MDGARLNFSHGTHEEHARRRAAGARDRRRELGRPLALIADLQGPKLRVGDLDEPVTLRAARRSSSVRRAGSANGDLPVSPAVIGEVLQPGPRRADRRRPRPAARREVEPGARAAPSSSAASVTSHKGVNLPGVPLPIPSLTQKDIDDLELALELGVDYVALSFVRSAADVRDLRALIEAARLARRG